MVEEPDFDGASYEVDENDPRWIRAMEVAQNYHRSVRPVPGSETGRSFELVCPHFPRIYLSGTDPDDVFYKGRDAIAMAILGIWGAGGMPPDPYSGPNPDSEPSPAGF